MGREHFGDVLRFAIVFTWMVHASALEEDSVAAAITVYRNPEFFRNYTRQEEGLKQEDETQEEHTEEDLYDPEEIYRHPQEPDPPKPPESFIAFFEELPDHEDVSEEEEQENEESNQIEDDEEDVPAGESGKSTEEEELPSRVEDTNIEDKYNVKLDKDLEPRTSPRLYEESKHYYNPIFRKDIHSFSYPPPHITLGPYYAPYRKKKTVPSYYRPSFYELSAVEPSEGYRADSKHVFRAVSKVKFGPVILVPYRKPYRVTKIKLTKKPRKKQIKFVLKKPVIYGFGR